MIDVTSEKLIRFRDVPALKWLPDSGSKRPMRVSTVYRWAQHGTRGVKLEFVVARGTRCTTEAALLRFFERLAAPAADAKSVTPSEQKAAQKRAASILDRAGI